MNNKQVISVNLFGGPGCGKSTFAARIFSDLKISGVNCELVTEYAKIKTWEESFKTLQNQIYIFGKQQYSMWICSQHVDMIVTDSPLLLSCIYGDNNTLNKLAVEEFNRYNNINVFVNRASEYVRIGRTQTEKEAIDKDREIKEYLSEEGFGFIEKECNEKSSRDICKMATDELKRRG